MKRILPAAIAGIALAWTAPAFAHAHPTGTMPSANAKLSAPPKSVMIMFDDEVQPGLTRIEVKDNGHLVSVGKSMVAANHKDVTVMLAKAGAGRYGVVWHALDTDGHATHGQYSFTVLKHAMAKKATSAKKSKIKK